MSKSASPAVILSNLPSNLMKHGTKVSEAVLGSKTGKEVGACFWKIHPSLPKFMIIFKHKSDRDKWHKTSELLKTVVDKHGVVTSLVWYSRDKDQVMAEDEGARFDKDTRRKRLVSSSVSGSNKGKFS